MHTSLQFVLLLLAAAVIVVVLFRIMRLPPLLGYMLVGIVIGPYSLGWVPATEQTKYLAEFGVVFLMFSIGLEFSLPRLKTMRRIVFGLGSSQVVLTLFVVLLTEIAFGLDWRTGIALGGALAMSSTAIVSKMLSERLELNSAHGKHVIGVLLFQDLAVVPLLITLPALAHDAASLAPALGFAVLKAVIVLVLLLFLGQKLMRTWFHLIAKQKSSELFMLNVLLITLGLAFATELAGLSLALGAFLAGMLISETEYRYQVEDDIKPFRDVLLGLFFVTIGMLLDLRVVFDHFLWVVVFIIGFVVFKTLLIATLSRIFDANWGMAFRTALNLAQAGEFGFVILSQAGHLKLVDEVTMQVVLAGMVISMLIAPFIIERSEHMVRRLGGAEWMNQAMTIHRIALQAMSANQHVLVCGYGRSGQNLSRFLERENIPFMALDLDPQRVKEAAAAGESVVFGDASRREVLLASGLMRARALVISYSDTPSALRILHSVRELRPGLPVIVRTLDETDIDKLKEAGAAEVVAEIMEGSLMLATHALLLLGIPFNRVLKRIRETRAQRYNLFRGVFRGITDEAEDESEREQSRLHSIVINQNAKAIGKAIGELGLAKLNVEVTAIRRKKVRELAPGLDTRLEEGDVVVLLGTEENLAAAEIKLLQG